MSRYIDITYTSEKDNTPAEINTTFQENLNFENVNRISLSKIDLTLNKTLPFYIVPLKQPQTYIATKQDNGYFETIFNIRVYYYTSATLKYNEYPIYFKSEESSNYSNINYSTTDGGTTRTYNNFDNYFKCFKFSNFLNSVNTTLQNGVFSVFNLSTDSLKKVIPTFTASNNTLYYYSEINPTITNTLRYYNNLNELSADQGGYTIGYSQILSRELLRNFSTITTDSFDFIASTPVLVDTLTVSLSINSTTQKYTIYGQENNDYFEYLNFIQGLIIVSNNLPIVSTFINVKANTSFKLISNDTTMQQAIRSIIKLNLDHNTEILNRLIYSNNNIVSNSISVVKQSNISMINLIVFTVDRYGNATRLILNENDTVNITLAIS